MFLFVLAATTSDKLKYTQKLYALGPEVSGNKLPTCHPRIGSAFGKAAFQSRVFCTNRPSETTKEINVGDQRMSPARIFSQYQPHTPWHSQFSNTTYVLKPKIKTIFFTPWLSIHIRLLAIVFEYLLQIFVFIFSEKLIHSKNNHLKYTYN